ncbi:MAG: hypothetical protein K8F54_01095 [Altibacter sp.]|uniref:hypothetical protein n=1 Tax=Altibacter sp. TaxID=2024823 RepID=UPI001DE97A8B|nr:hypothetical protein [Altibacter sp.]MBZ0326174.1 hypothetical protein [Altibacter sp.]
MTQSLSTKILILNLILILLAFIVGFYWNELGFSNHDQNYLALAVIIIFGLSVGGLFAGIVEHNYDQMGAIIGIIGNALLIIISISIFILAIEHV